MDLLPGLRDDNAERSKRGRPPSAVSTNFYRLNEKCNRSMWWTVCKYCYAAHLKESASVPFPVHIHGRKDAWEKHLSECLYYIRVTGNPLQGNENEAGLDGEGDSNKRHCATPPQFTPAEKMVFWRLLLEYQAEALLPDSFVELLSFRRLLVFLNTRCGGVGAIPHRHVLGGRVLSEYADLHSAEQRDNVRAIQNRTGGRVNFLSDVWENIAKIHVLGCLVALFGRIMTYGLRPTGDRHDGVAIAEQMEGVIEELQASEWKVGAVVTDNAGQCARARRILAPRYPKIAFLFCFAHDVNNLVKAVLKTVFKDISKDAAGVASFLNTSTSKWLVRAMKAMSKRYGDSFAVFTLCETRWNSMQACFASLLRVRGAMEDMVFTYRNSSDLPDKLRILGDVDFWTKLETAEKIIRPLCTASFRLQRDENSVGDVVLSYMEIYRSFASSELSDSLTELVETRWNACEQPLFILGFFLHPDYVVEARKLPLTVLTGLDDVCQFSQYYYRRFVCDDDSGLRGEMFKWIQGEYTTSRSVDFSEDSVMSFWEYEKNSKPDSKLPILALTILSIVVNTATCERLFSELALIHTPKRNRMTVEKTLKHEVMRQYVREKNRSEKTHRTNSKKLLRTIDPRERESIPTPNNSTRNTPSQLSTPLRRTRANESTPLPPTPAPESRHVNSVSDGNIQDQASSPPLTRVLFPGNRIEACPSSNVDQTPVNAGRVSPTRRAIASPTTEYPQQAQLDGYAVDSLTSDMDTVALSNSQLDEYLEHFDWEEIGEYGDEATVEMWDSAFNRQRTPTSSCTSTTNNGEDTEPDTDGSPFTTARLGSHADVIPAARREPYPQENDHEFPQESHLTGIRARKASLFSLVVG